VDLSLNLVTPTGAHEPLSGNFDPNHAHVTRVQQQITWVKSDEITAGNLDIAGEMRIRETAVTTGVRDGPLGPAAYEGKLVMSQAGRFVHRERLGLGVGLTSMRNAY
jgi:hypothetical protein